MYKTQMHNVLLAQLFLIKYDIDYRGKMYPEVNSLIEFLIHNWSLKIKCSLFYYFIHIFMTK